MMLSTVDRCALARRLALFLTRFSLRPGKLNSGAVSPILLYKLCGSVLAPHFAATSLRWLARTSTRKRAAADWCSMEANKRPRRGKAWPNVSLFGPGGDDGGELLRELAGEPDTLEALFACTMGLNAEAILGMLGVRRDVFAVIACHHPERCWQVKVRVKG